MVPKHNDFPQTLSEDFSEGKWLLTTASSLQFLPSWQGENNSQWRECSLAAQKYLETSGKLPSKGNYVILAYPETEFILKGPRAKQWFLHCPVPHLRSHSQPKVSCLQMDNRLFWGGDLSEQLIL